MPKFSLKNAYCGGGEKRDGPYADASGTLEKKQKLKAPAADSLVVMESVNRVARPKSLPASAPLVVTIYKISNRAGDLWTEMTGDDVGLWQVQLDCQLCFAMICFYVLLNINAL